MLGKLKVRAAYLLLLPERFCTFGVLVAKVTLKMATCPFIGLDQP